MITHALHHNPKAIPSTLTSFRDPEKHKEPEHGKLMFILEIDLESLNFRERCYFVHDMIRLIDQESRL